jgi:DNA-binding transcriptional ArsR family regulator
MSTESPTLEVVGLPQPGRDEIEMSAVLHALSDPQRLQIVRRLAEAKVPIQCRGMGLGVSKSTATHHFRVLREAGVISQQRFGTSKLNTLRREDLDVRFPGLLAAVLAG